VDAAALEASPRLKVVANVAVGYDNIDVDAATERGVVVTNTPDVLTETTAELTLALLLALARRVVEADRYVRAGRFRGWELRQPHLGTDLHGKTLGLFGMGRIGQAVGRRAALGFGLDVRYTARAPKPALDWEYGFRPVDFDTLLRESDFLSLHAPLTPDTRHRFTLAEFERMKPTALLVNAARGPLVKEAALAAALERGLIQGAALDVFEREPEVHPRLKKHDRTVLTPHIGSATERTRRRMCEIAVNNVVAALSGRCPPTALNPQAWSG